MTKGIKNRTKIKGKNKDFIETCREIHIKWTDFSL